MPTLPATGRAALWSVDVDSDQGSPVEWLPTDTPTTAEPGFSSGTAPLDFAVGVVSGSVEVSLTAAGDDWVAIPAAWSPGAVAPDRVRFRTAVDSTAATVAISATRVRL